MSIRRVMVAVVAAWAAVPVARAQVWGMPADFSSVQSQRNFFYGYRAGSGPFTQMPEYGVFPASWTVQWGSGGFWTFIAPNIMHPNGTFTSGGRRSADQTAVLRWVSPMRGSASISGRIAKQLPGGNGVVWGVVRNATEPLVSITLAGTDTTGQEFQALTRVRPGDTIDFTLDANQGNDGGDSTLYSFTIVVCPADIDDGTCTGVPDGGVDVADLSCFLSKLEAGDRIADIDDGSGRGVPDNAVDINDFVYFLQRFDRGC